MGERSQPKDQSGFSCNSWHLAARRGRLEALRGVRLSRVTQIPELADQPVHAAQVVSICSNLAIGFLLIRLAGAGSDISLLCGVYLILTDFGRFAEQGLRGEPQTPRYRGLDLYQWLCILFVIAGMVVSGGPTFGVLPKPALPSLQDFTLAALVALVWVVAMSVDWPSTGWRCSRLAPCSR